VTGAYHSRHSSAAAVLANRLHKSLLELVHLYKNVLVLLDRLSATG